jgi:hypothetical protein
MSTFILVTLILDYHILLPSNKSIMSLPTIILGGLDTRNQCFNLNISNKDLVDLAYPGLSPHLKEKLESCLF